jgi:hypothetical protein
MGRTMCFVWQYIDKSSVWLLKNSENWQNYQGCWYYGCYGIRCFFNRLEIFKKIPCFLFFLYSFSYEIISFLKVGPVFQSGQAFGNYFYERL